jgi:tetratricopeptide (TPR) repeat protein
MAFGRHRRWRKRIADADSALSLSPPGGARALADLSVIRGLASLRLRKLDQAKASLLRARVFDPNSRDANEVLWSCCFERGEFGNCLRLGERLVREHPRHSFGHWMCAKALLIFGQTSKAVQFSTKATQINPKDSYAWSVSGMARFRQGQYDEAASAFKRALQLRPTNLDTRIRAAFFFAACPDDRCRDGVFATNLSSIEDAPLHDKRHRQLLLITRAVAYAELGLYHDAVVTAKRGIETCELDSEMESRYGQLVESFQKEVPYRFDPSISSDQRLFEIPVTIRIGNVP